MKPIKEIFDPIYRQTYWYVCAPTHKQFRDIIWKAVKKEVSPKDGTLGQTLIIGNFNDGSEVILIWTKKKQMDILIHEIFHAVVHALRRRGLPLSKKSGEAYSYLMEFLAREITK